MNKSEKLKHKALKPVRRHQELSFAEYASKAAENLPKEFQGRSFYYNVLRLHILQRGLLNELANF
jgi:hypothetical protein